MTRLSKNKTRNIHPPSVRLAEDGVIEYRFFVDDSFATSRKVIGAKRGWLLSYRREPKRSKAIGLRYSDEQKILASCPESSSVAAVSYSYSSISQRHSLPTVVP